MSKVIKKDLGLDKIIMEMKKIDNSFSKVGFPSGVDDVVTEQAKIASWLNLGTSRNPKSWPFMFNAFNKNLGALINLRNKLYKRILKGSMSVENALQIMGQFVEDKIKKEITDLRQPALEESTVRKKKSTNPLIHHGTMRTSVTHVEVIK